MDERSAGLERVECVGDRSQLGNLNADRVRDVLRLGGRWCDDGRNRLADEAHNGARQDRLFDRLIIEFVQHRPDRPRAGEVLGANDRYAARRADADDAAGRNGAADEADVVRRWKIGGETAAPGDQCRVLEPPDGTADPLHSGAGGSGHV